MYRIANSIASLFLLLTAPYTHTMQGEQITSQTFSQEGKKHAIQFLQDVTTQSNVVPQNSGPIRYEWTKLKKIYNPDYLFLRNRKMRIANALYHKIKADHEIQKEYHQSLTALDQDHTRHLFIAHLLEKYFNAENTRLINDFNYSTGSPEFRRMRANVRATHIFVILETVLWQESNRRCQN